jgi:hypothetical protein
MSEAGDFFFGDPYTADARPAAQPKPKPSFIEGFSAGYEAQTKARNRVSEARALERAYDKRIDALVKSGGPKLANPFRADTIDLGGTSFALPRLPSAFGTSAEDRQSAMRTFERRYGEAAKGRPAVRLPTHDEMMAEVYSDARDAEGREAVASDGAGFAGSAGLFAGQVIGAFQDPANLSTSVVSGGGSAAVAGAKSLIVGATREAGLNAVIQGIQEPAVQDFRKRAGLDAGLDVALKNIGTAAAGGAAFHVGGELVGKGLQAITKVFDRGADAARVAADLPTDVVEALGATLGDKPPIARAAAHVLERERELAEARPVDVTRSEHDEVLTRTFEALEAGAPAPTVMRTFSHDDALAQEATMPSLRVLRPDRAFAPDGRVVDVEYGVVDLGDLKASHDPFSFESNPLFPAELQPRDRADNRNVLAVRRIAENLQPERLGETFDAATGAPIVGPSGVVESGNGRVMALARAYAENGPQAGAYRDYLVSRGYPVENMQNPVLVRVRATPLDAEGMRDWTMAANGRTTTAMSVVETSAADSVHLDADVMGLYRGGALDKVENAAFARAALARMADATELNELVRPNGALSADGVRRLKAALMQRAYDDGDLIARLYEDPSPEIKGIGQALEGVAGEWSAMRLESQGGRIAANVDATRDLMEAVGLFRQWREKGLDLTRIYETTDMFGRSSLAHEFLRLLFVDGSMKRARAADKVAADLAAYARSARATQPGVNLFGGEDPNADEILGRIIGQKDSAVASNGSEGVDLVGLAEAPRGGTDPGLSTVDRAADSAGIRSTSPIIDTESAERALVALDDPNGVGADAQADRLAAQMENRITGDTPGGDLFGDGAPVDFAAGDDAGVARTMTRAEIKTEIERDQTLLDRLKGCADHG